MSIAGYTYGTSDVARSPVSWAEFEQLKRSVLLEDDDFRYLRVAGDILAPQVPDLFACWYPLVGQFMDPTYAAPDGEVDQRYVERAMARFFQWVLDTCRRAYDQDWLDYQHEIGLRHHRSKKNQTDGVSSVENVPLRYLITFLYPMTATIRPFLARSDSSQEDVDRMAAAWTKSLVLQVALWSHPYVTNGDW